MQLVRYTRLLPGFSTVLPGFARARAGHTPRNAIGMLERGDWTRFCSWAILGLAFMAWSLLPSSAHAQLAAGAKAPSFSTQAALAGTAFVFDLQSALKQGPVVVYFYPKAFTSGCTIEAQLFAQAMDDFKAANTTVIGVSGDDIETLKRFSEGPCGGKFAVASDASGQIIKSYDAGLSIIPGMADRISYSIAPDGTILDVYESMSPDQHVTRTLAAVRQWQGRNVKGTTQ